MEYKIQNSQSKYFKQTDYSRQVLSQAPKLKIEIPRDYTYVFLVS